MSRHKVYVLGFVFDPFMEKVLLIEKNRPEDQAGKLNGIGGMVRRGEDVSDAMVREMIEEANIGIPGVDWGPIATLMYPYSSIHVFAATFSITPLMLVDNSPTDEKLRLVKVSDVTRSIPTDGFLYARAVPWLVSLATEHHKNPGFVIASMNESISVDPTPDIPRIDPVPRRNELKASSES